MEEGNTIHQLRRMEGTLFQQYGGRIIGDGSYGCIFDPPIHCIGRKGPVKEKTLGKFVAKDDVQEELDAAKYFSKISNAKDYCIFLELGTGCSYKKLDVKTEPDMHLCDKYQETQSDKTNEVIQYTMSYGGVNIKKFMASIHIPTFSFFKFCVELLEAVTFLTLNGYVHNDLHEGNVVVDEHNNIKLIDFGRSYSLQYFKMPHLTVYSSSSDITPPELAVYDGLHNDVSVKNVLNDIYTKKAGMLLSERVLGVNRRTELIRFKQFLDSSISYQKKDWPAFFKLYWPQVDSWAVGSTLLKMFTRILSNPSFEQNISWKKKRNVIEQVLRGLLRASPVQRFDCVEALAILDPMNKLLKTASGKSWLAAKKIRATAS